jgi:hypothetical protein
MEKLTGKLSWERTANGIRVEIPGWMGWSRTLFLSGWLAFWIYFGIPAGREHRESASLFSLLWLSFWAVAGVYTFGTIVWSILGRIVLTLDPSRLNLTYTLAGIEIRQRSSSTHEIHNLRYRPVAGMGQPKYPGVICFESNGKTRNFASCTSGAEAFALIGKMLEVYPFPKERALEYLDISR